MGQIAKQLADMNQNPFSGNTHTNPKEHCKSITTRSGKEIGVGIGDNLRENEKNGEFGKKVESEKISVQKN